MACAFVFAHHSKNWAKIDLYLNRNVCHYYRKVIILMIDQTHLKSKMAAVHGCLTLIGWCERWCANNGAGVTCVGLVFNLFSVYFDDTANINWNRKTVQIKSSFKYNICHFFGWILSLILAISSFSTWPDAKRRLVKFVKLNQNLTCTDIKT